MRIDAFNANLVARGVQVDIRGYIKEINDEIFKQPIETFADDLVDLVFQDECCISQDKLVKYGVLADVQTSGHVLRIITQYKLVLNVDFRPTSDASRGGRPATIYMFHPDAFELCLMRSKNTRIYARYYSLVHKCVFFYNKYQIATREHAVARLTSKNTDLERMVQELIRTTNQRGDEAKADRSAMSADLGEMKADLREIKGQNATLIDSVYAVKRQNDVLAGASLQISAKLGVVSGRRVAAAADIALPPGDNSKSDSFVLLALDDAKYHVLRTQTKSVTAEMRKQRGKYPGMREVLHLRDVPNSKHLWNRGRETLGDRIKTTSPSHTTFTLERDTTEVDVIDTMNKLHGEPTKRAEDDSSRDREWVGEQLVTVEAAQDSTTHVMTIVETTVTKTRTVKLDAAELDAALLEMLNL
jgi:hypothetical protein